MQNGRHHVIKLREAEKESDKYHETKISIGDVKIDPLMYIDDVERLTGSAEGAREGGEIFTNALNELGLEAHPDKSAQIIMGKKKFQGKKFQEKVRAELKDNPVRVQDFELKEAEEETYLGMQISNKGVKDSVSKSIKKRINAFLVIIYPTLAPLNAT